MTPAGFPHSDIPGSKCICHFPRLIAAYHVLHRLLVPRHPPCALSNLTGLPFGACFAQLITRSHLFDCQRPGSAGWAEMPAKPRGIHGRSLAESVSDPAGAEARGIESVLTLFILVGGDSGDRTRNLRLAKPALCQLSYIPGREVVVSTIRRRRIGAPGRWWA